MCGICGFYSKKNIGCEHLKAMNDTMIHRGPDDSGEEIYEAKNGYRVGLAQRRLSIIDLSDSGHQPMTSIDSRISIVFNGEIYNYLELKKELLKYSFHTSSDTEVILAAYLKWGPSCVEHFNGMFAIAIYDRSSEEIWLFRDRIGKKPLYYWLDEQGLVFASELKAIMSCPGFRKDIRRDILPRYLVHGYINAPDTVFKDVYKLESGSRLRYFNGKADTYKYWDIAETYHQMRRLPVNDYSKAKKELKQLLKIAVEHRMVADVPLGSLLSGGYDSSLVSAMAQEVLGSEPLRTFSIGFHEESYNEAEYAKKVAFHLGMKHTELYCDKRDMLKLIETIPYYFDEPFADSSQIPTMLVSKLAKQDVTVVLSGDGGDEFFCGYNIYDKVRQAQWFDFLGSLAHTVGRVGNLEEHFPSKIKLISKNRNQDTKVQLTSDYLITAVKSMLPVIDSTSKTTEINYWIERHYHEPNWQARRMLLDMDTYLPGDILTKVDRASMRYSLECRCPILDKDVMEYSFRIRHKFKYNNGEKKAILKDIAYDYIPRELLDRPKKGFSIPLDQWMRCELRDKLLAYSNSILLKRQGLFDIEAVSRFVDNYLNNGIITGTYYDFSWLCWNFLVFQLWYEHWM